MVSKPSALIWDDDRLRYDFGPQHPLKPIRVELTVELIRSCGLDGLDGVLTLPSAPFTTEDLYRVHDEGYVAAVRRQSETPVGDPAYGLGPGDNPVFEGMHEASMRVCAASVAAAQAVWEGEAGHAFNPAGGLHHAMHDRAAGFCIYNDPAFAIAWLLDHGARRIAYVDIDTHHGDGVQELFYDDERVLTISLHESGRYLFPGTGFTSEIGTGAAEGTALNVPLAPATTGSVYLEAFEAIVPPALELFGPDVLVTQLGCDTHVTDPLAHLALVTDDYLQIGTRLHELAHRYAHGRWVATGGGGYQIATVVPRAWTIHFSILAHADVPHEVPWDFLHTAEEAVGERPPGLFLDGPVRLASDRLAAVRADAQGSVEKLKAATFDLLERRS